MKGKIFQHRLKEAFRQSGNKVAIEYGKQRFTYEELDKKSDDAAGRILARGFEREMFIGILLEDRIELIAAIIGILKAGCVFVPLDPANPLSRLQAMINSTGIKYLLVDEVGYKWLETGYSREEVHSGMKKPGYIRIDNPHHHNKTPEIPHQFPISYSPEDKIYVYFTSGTTDTPKGIVGKNKSLLQFIEWEIETFEINSDFRISQFITPGFDAFLRDVFVTLCAGGTLCIPEDKDIILNADNLTQWIDDNRINLMHGVPSFFRLISSNHMNRDYFKDLKYIMLSGEKIHPPDLTHWYYIFGDRVQLVNFYGPTETTMIKSYYLIRMSDVHKNRIPIGKPIKGTRILICNENMNQCGELIKGEIYIRTPYRTYGYYNEPELNEKKFIKNPFSEDPDDLLYRTGDIGRVLPDGNIEFIGRMDRQIKIRGIRIELEEIEYLLAKHQAINEAVVIKKKFSNQNELLLAYITIACDTNHSQLSDSLLDNLKTYLSDNLPEYMVPAQIVKLDIMPRKPNGKIDYDKLPDPFQCEDAAYIPPKNNLEEEIAVIWSEILGTEKIGITSSFFDLGGHSLNVMSLISSIHKKFNLRISLADVFRNPTIEKQAGIIKRIQNE